MKSKACFIVFKGLSMKQITEIFLEGESPTLRNVKEIPEIPRIVKVLSWPYKSQIFAFVLQKCQKSAVKDFIEKQMLLKFVNLPVTFCPRLSEETYFMSNLTYIFYIL